MWSKKAGGVSRRIFGSAPWRGARAGYLVGQRGDARPHVGQHPVAVVHYEPAEPPAGHQPALADPVARDHGHRGREAGHRVERHPLAVGYVAVDLVGDDDQAVAVGDAQDGLEVLPGVDHAHRVRGVVDDDGAGAAGDDLALQVLQVHQPALLHPQPVVARRDPVRVRQRLVLVEADLRHEDVVVGGGGGLGDGEERQLQRVRTPVGQEHVVGADEGG